MVTERRVSEDTRRAARAAHKMVALDLRPGYHVRYEYVAQFSDDPFGWFIWVDELPGVWATAPTPAGVEGAARAAIASAIDVAPDAFDVHAEDRSQPGPGKSAHRVPNSQETKGKPRVTVGPRTGGGWQVTGEDQTYKTQREAEQAARRQLANGGGELVVKGRDGRVRMQNTIGQPDPRRSKGKRQSMPTPGASEAYAAWHDAKRALDAALPWTPEWLQLRLIEQELRSEWERVALDNEPVDARAGIDRQDRSYRELDAEVFDVEAAGGPAEGPTGAA
jgi:hypothetical protein